jgi:hypothetical protein
MTTRSPATATRSCCESTAGRRRPLISVALWCPRRPPRARSWSLSTSGCRTRVVALPSAGGAAFHRANGLWSWLSQHRQENGWRVLRDVMRSSSSLSRRCRLLARFTSCTPPWWVARRIAWAAYAVSRQWNRSWRMADPCACFAAYISRSARFKRACTEAPASGPSAVRAPTLKTMHRLRAAGSRTHRIPDARPYPLRASSPRECAQRRRGRDRPRHGRAAASQPAALRHAKMIPSARPRDHAASVTGTR